MEVHTLRTCRCTALGIATLWQCPWWGSKPWLDACRPSAGIMWNLRLGPFCLSWPGFPSEWGGWQGFRFSFFTACKKGEGWTMTIVNEGPYFYFISFTNFLFDVHRKERLENWSNLRLCLPLSPGHEMEEPPPPPHLAHRIIFWRSMITVESNPFPATHSCLIKFRSSHSPK